jgi:hypothetical protein
MAASAAASDATVGRIIRHLVERGVVEPVPLKRSPHARRWTTRGRFATRLPKDLTDRGEAFYRAKPRSVRRRSRVG